MTTRARRLRGAQRGLSLVELLVGSAIGLVLVGGASKLFVDSMDDSRRIIIETRVHQDLRAAADLVARDLKRAGYWANALQGVAYPPLDNPYRIAAPTAASGPASQVDYAFARDADNAVNATTEQFGFRLQDNAIRVLNGGTWQQLTDPGTVVITQFSVTPVTRVVSLGHFCSPVCAPGSAGCPAVSVRRFDIVLRGRAPNDAAVVREIRESVRLRNDEVAPAACP